MIPHRDIRRGLAALTVLILVLLWGGLALYLRYDKTQTIDNANRQGENLSRAFAEHITSILRSFDQTSRAMVSEYERAPKSFDAATAIERHAVLRDATIQVGVIGADGYLITSNLPVVSKERVYLGDREHFKVHVARDTGELFISKPVIGRVSGRWSIQLTRRINNPDGSFGGFMLISLDPEYLSKFYESIDIGRNGVITVVGLDGIVRARATGSGETAIGQSLKQAELWHALSEAPNGRFEVVSPIDETDRLFNYTSIAGYPLVVNVGLARSDVLTHYARRRNVLLAAALAISLLVIAAAGLLMRQAGLQMQIEAELRRYQEELIESRNEADAANRAKSEFLANMSHELRTPLNAIIGFSEFMAGGGLGPVGSPKYLEYARDINNSGRHLLDMISEVLDMSKIEAGQYELVPEDVDVSDTVEFCVRLVAGRAEAGQISLVNQVSPELPKARADARALRQILLNLLSNAVKFTPAGGRVTVSAAANGQHEIRLIVSDTGVGINAADLKRIGEPFRQLGRSLTKPQEGTGLGLAITKRLVEMHGGYVEIESAPGRGTAVMVNLPAARAPDRRVSAVG
ncbi:MAG TPA: ATP-binding protein [Alphaproteobacteria bacterium]|nr:ATP-binding protein [Alphaproteobacteria bacterium]